jgi:hypothetical protein
MKSHVSPKRQHRELRRGQPHRVILSARPHKAAPIKHLVVEAKPLPIPEQKLHPVTPDGLETQTPRH